jgi:hypothetical protein
MCFSILTLMLSCHAKGLSKQKGVIVNYVFNSVRGVFFYQSSLVVTSMVAGTPANLQTMEVKFIQLLK